MLCYRDPKPPSPQCLDLPDPAPAHLQRTANCGAPRRDDNGRMPCLFACLGRATQPRRPTWPVVSARKYVVVAQASFNICVRSPAGKANWPPPRTCLHRLRLRMRYSSVCNNEAGHLGRQLMVPVSLHDTEPTTGSCSERDARDQVGFRYRVLGSSLPICATPSEPSPGGQWSHREARGG